MAENLNNLVFKNFEDVSTSVSKYRGITSDNKIVTISFIEGSCDIGVGENNIEALRNRAEAFYLPQNGDYISRGELFERMGWAMES